MLRFILYATLLIQLSWSAITCVLNISMSMEKAFTDGDNERRVMYSRKEGVR